MINREDPRLKKIKLILLDVDGVLTDGTVFYIKDQGWTRRYHIHDGYGIKLIQKLGIPVGVMSGGNSEELHERMRLLGIQHTVLGSEDKLASLMIIQEKTKIPLENICFMGDDLFDIPALKKVGLAVTVPNAVAEVKQVAHHITDTPGGQGAARELIDAIRYAQNLE